MHNEEEKDNRYEPVLVRLWICFVNLRVWENAFFLGEIRILYIIYRRDKMSRRGRGATLTDTSCYQSHVTHPLKFDKIGLNKEKTRNWHLEMRYRQLNFYHKWRRICFSHMSASSIPSLIRTRPSPHNAPTCLLSFGCYKGMCVAFTRWEWESGRRGQGDKKKENYKRRIYFQSDVPSWLSPLISTVALKTQFPASNKRLKITQVTVTLAQVRAASQVWLTIDVYLIRWKICSGACGCPFRADAHVTFFLGPANSGLCRQRRERAGNRWIMVQRWERKEGRGKKRNSGHVTQL